MNITNLFSRFSLKTCSYYGARNNSRRVVYHSDDDTPYHNLAFEEWIYDNVDLSKSSCMLIWRSKPSVVIGRHQNPWLECNLKYLRDNSMFLARRQTGGGTVYHDHGNLNVTFFTSRSSYSRKCNLRLIISALEKKFPFLNLSINNRDDIVMDGKYKVSGSAAKLGRRNAYHHCTILNDANLKLLSSALKPSLSNINTKATSSVRSKTKNLSRCPGDITHQDMQSALTEEYMARAVESEEPYIIQADPSDNNTFEGVKDIIDRLNSWKWIYAKSPKFAIEIPCVGKLSVADGLVSAVESYSECGLSVAPELEKQLLGVKLARSDLQSFREKYAAELSSDKNKYICSLLENILTNI